MAEDTIDARVQVPRALGRGFVSVQQAANGSRLRDLRMSGCLKLLFSRATERVETVMLNTSGGLTSGDHISLEAQALDGAHLSLTTQAAERAYRAEDDVARVKTNLKAGEAAKLFWLPQELILFDGARLSRRLTCALDPSSRALLVEPIVFGRAAMGEVLRFVDFRDEICVTSGGTPIFRDVIHVLGDAEAHLSRRITAAGAGAMVTILLVAPDAEAQLTLMRELLPDTAGASLVNEGVLVIRALAKDSLEMRRFLIPLLDHLTQDTLPVCWRL